MCFSPEVSLLAWIVSISISVFLYNRNRNYDRWNAAFIVSFSTIQLLEAGLWVNLNNPNINSLLTQLVFLTLLSEPLIQSFMGYHYTRNGFLQVLSYVMLGVFLWGLYRVLTSSKGQYYTEIGQKGHLVWRDNGNDLLSNVFPLWIFGLFVPLFFMKGYKGVILVAIGIATALFSLLYASGSPELGSFWCFLTVFYAIAAIFV